MMSIGDRQLHYSSTSAMENRPALVFVHGAGASSADWPYQWQQTGIRPNPVEPRWISDYPRYFLDLAGHGRSPGPAYPSVEDYAGDVVALTEAVNIQRAVMIGHSMGAAVALAAGLLQPSNLAGLVLLGGGPAMPVSNIILDGLRGDFVQTVGLIMKFCWSREARALDREVATQHMLAAGSETVLGDFMACDAFDVTDQLGEIRVPTLVVGSLLDRMTPLGYSEALAAGIPDARLAVIEEAGHYMMTERTNAVNTVLLPFLREIG